jgi:glycosyltransferase involved in cell wall biosynthesis
VNAVNGAPARVCVLHNYRDTRQPSMRLYAERLGEELVARGIEVERVRPGAFLPEGLRRGRVMEKIDQYGGRFVSYPRRARHLSADLFHLVDHGEGHLVGDLDPSRTVVTCHDVILLVQEAGRLRTGQRRLLATKLLRRALRHVARTRWIVADSEQTRRDLADLAGIDPATVRVVVPGLNHPYAPDPALGAEARLRLRLGPGTVLLHVGGVDFYKNVEGCLRVLARLRKGGLDATLVRAGSSLTSPQKHLAERLGVAGAVRDLGPVPASELAALYNASDLLLFPSHYEGFGWPPLEAMASGLPVVCSRAGSLPEVVGEAALTAEPEDVAGLADHASALLGTPALASSLRRLGIERAAAFTWARTASGILEVYARALGRG